MKITRKIIRKFGLNPDEFDIPCNIFGYKRIKTGSIGWYMVYIAQGIFYCMILIALLICGIILKGIM